MTLPPIREWWTELSADARQSVLDADPPRLDESVREEIREITGAVVGMIETPTKADLAWARKNARTSE